MAHGPASRVRSSASASLLLGAGAGVGTHRSPGLSSKRSLRGHQRVSEVGVCAARREPAQCYVTCAFFCRFRGVLFSAASALGAEANSPPAGASRPAVGLRASGGRVRGRGAPQMALTNPCAISSQRARACESYACLLFTRGSLPLNFIFTPEARVLREHGVLTPPRFSAAERRLCIVTDSFLSIFPHLLPGNVAASGRGDVWAPRGSTPCRL